MTNLSTAERAFLHVPDSYTLQDTEENDDDNEVIEFMCPDCKEWTTSDDPCCGVLPRSYNEDSINGDR